MKALLVIACVFLASLVGAMEEEESLVAQTKKDNTLNDMVIKFLEDLRISMTCGNPEMGIPVMAPLHLDHLEMDIDQKGLKIAGELNNMVIDGLNEFEIKKIDIKALKLQMDFEFYFGAIRTKGKYKLKGKVISLFPFSRFGRFRFDAKGLSVNGSVKVGISGDKLQIRELIITPTLKSVRSDVKNIFLNPVVNFAFNRIVEGIVPGMINDNQQAITDAITNNLKPAINEMLGSLSLQDLIDMVSGDGGSTPAPCIRSTEIPVF